MPAEKQKFYISTAIPYVNSDPHIGFALEIIQADVVARYHRLLGEDVFFVTGTDENALKNVLAAEEKAVSPKELVDANAGKFRELSEILNISNDDFIRTTEDRHIRGAQKLWEACKEEDIYKKKYRGLYCVGCEEFYKESELVDGCCPEHKTKPEVVEEENYFFRLSSYQKKLEKLISTDEFRVIPETRKNEVLSFIRQGLEDFSISRSNERARNWGVPVPGDDSQRIFVWVDALSNYINALGYADDSEKFKEFWQDNENILHCIGKGILRFHGIYWIAILLSAGLRLPKTIFVHGYLMVDGQKISKTLGNVVSPKDVVQKYGTDSVRYYLLREISSTEDGDFSYKKFEGRYNADFAKGLGNLVLRVLTLAEKNTRFKSSIKSSIFQKDIDDAWKNYRKALEEFKFNDALEAVWRLIGVCDEYISKEKPWEEKESSAPAISNLLLVLGHVAWMVKPFLPETSDKIFKQLGIDPESETPWEEQELKINKGEALFPRL